MVVRQLVFSALSEPSRSFLTRELMAHSEELRASRQDVQTQSQHAHETRIRYFCTQMYVFVESLVSSRALKIVVNRGMAACC